MKMIIGSATAIAALLFFSAAPLVSAHGKEKGSEEKTIKMSDAPAAVQKTFNTEAKGGKIVRVEMEGADYEAVIEKNGKTTGVKVSADGKLINRHDESKEKSEKTEKAEKANY